MDPALLRYYNTELQHVRQSAAEFALEYPKIAGRLGLEEFECADPYVERLLEGFAYLAARLQLKIDREFPKFTRHLLDVVYPHFLAPTPSLAVAQMRPEPDETALAEGYVVPAGSTMRGMISSGEQTACQFRSCRDMTLWPLVLEDARYLSSRGDLAAAGKSIPSGARAGVRINFSLTAGLSTEKLHLDTLSLYLRGAGDLTMRLLEAIHCRSTGIIVQTGEGRDKVETLLPNSSIRMPGFEPDETMIPFGLRSFQGYRLLQEYFSFAAGFQFVDIGGLRSALNAQKSKKFSIVICFSDIDDVLTNAVDKDLFSLHCVPIINLFKKTCDRIHLSPRDSELHLVPDRARPMDFEVHSIEKVSGYGESLQEEIPFEPLYWSNDRINGFEDQAYYTTIRRQRLLSSRRKREGPRSSYIGSEVFLIPCDGQEAPYPHDLKQIAVKAACTNRDLPLQMPVGQGETDFTLTSGAPVQSVRCVAGPTQPRASFAQGESAWRLISHLSLNYLSLFDPSEGNGASSLRELLELYIDRHDSVQRRQVSSITNINCRQIVRRIPIPGPMVAARGLEVTVTVDETGFEGSSSFTLGKILEQFFARFVSINSFTETVLVSQQRGEIMRWPVVIGRRQTI